MFALVSLISLLAKITNTFYEKVKWKRKNILHIWMVFGTYNCISRQRGLENSPTRQQECDNTSKSAKAGNRLTVHAHPWNNQNNNGFHSIRKWESYSLFSKYGLNQQVVDVVWFSIKQNNWIVKTMLTAEAAASSSLVSALLHLSNKGCLPLGWRLQTPHRAQVLCFTAASFQTFHNVKFTNKKNQWGKKNPLMLY